MSRFDERFASGLRVDKNANTVSSFLALAYLCEESADQRYLPMLEEWARWAMHDLNRARYGGMHRDTYQGPNPG